jgi:hypothetical protein
VLSRFRGDAPIKARQETDPAPVIDHALAIAGFVEIRSDDNRGIGFAAQRTNEIRRLLSLHGPLGEFVRTTSRLLEEFPDGGLPIAVVEGEGGEPLLNDILPDRYELDRLRAGGDADEDRNET